MTKESFTSQLKELNPISSKIVYNIDKKGGFERKNRLRRDNKGLIDSIKTTLSVSDRRHLLRILLLVNFEQVYEVCSHCFKQPRYRTFRMFRGIFEIINNQLLMFKKVCFNCWNNIGCSQWYTNYLPVSTTRRIEFNESHRIGTMHKH